jgi:hypothetical protein
MSYRRDDKLFRQQMATLADSLNKTKPLRTMPVLAERFADSAYRAARSHAVRRAFLIAFLLILLFTIKAVAEVALMATVVAAPFSAPALSSQTAIDH